MRQLSTIDAAFFNLDRKNSTGHIGTVCLLDPDPERPLTLQGITELVASRLHLVPIMRQRLVEVPLGLDNPYWIDDQNFDIEYHVRDISLPPPGSYAQLCEQISRLHARPLDKRRPLWEIYLIHGLEDGKYALYTKMHHASIDGASGAELLGLVVDLEPNPAQPTDIPDFAPRPEPSPTELLRRSALSLGARPGQAARITRSAFRLATGVRLPALTELVPGLGHKTEEETDANLGSTESAVGLLPPKTPFNAPISPHRRVAMRTVDLGAVKDVKNAFDASINDVVMAMATGGLRAWLDEKGELPEQPLVSMVPVSLKDPGSAAQGNALSVLRAALPTNLATPTERITALREVTTTAKQKQAAIPKGLIDDVTDFAPPALVARTARLAFAMGLPHRVAPLNLVLSNVPGPNIQFYVGGAKLTAVYPISLLVDGQGLNITVMSYLGGLHIGLISCRELMPDLEHLADLVVEELEALTKDAGKQGDA